MEYFLENLTKYLADNGVGVIKEDLFMHRLAGEPINQIAVIDTGGVYVDGDIGVERPTVDIWVRNKDYLVAKNKARVIFELLHNTYTKDLGPTGKQTHIMRTDALTNMAPIATDNKDCYLFKVSFVFWLRK